MSGPYYLYIDIPVPIFAARVNMASISYPITALTFDGVTLGAFGDIQTDMTLILGSSAGADDLGRVRVQNVASSTQIPVGRISQGYEDGQLTVVDNAYITVWDDFRVHSKPPYILDDGTQLKDSDITVGSYTTTEPPVANMGIGFVGTINAGTGKITVAFDSVNSFAVADAATIASVAWDVGDGTITVGSSTTSAIVATFPAGKRWVSLTVTDSNGKSHTARTRVVARDPDDDVMLQHFDAELEITESGQTLKAAIYDDIPQVTYPDGALVIFVEGEPASPTDRSQMKFIGWEQSNDSDIRSSKTGFLRKANLNAVDVAGRLANLPGFSQEIESKPTPANWSEMTAPNMDKYIHYLLLWHSTALALADYFPSDTGSDYPFVTFNSDGESLYDQVNDQAKRLLPDHLFTCNTLGQLQVVHDPQLQDASDRTTFSWGTFDEDFTEGIQFSYTRPPKQHWVRGHAMLTQSDYTTIDGVDTLLTVHCIAPGTAPGQGVSETETTEGLVPSQVTLNAVTGHRYARLNSRYGKINITSPDDTLFTDLEPANMQWVNVSLPPAYAAQRGLALEVRCLVSRITRRYEAQRTGTLRKSQFELEVETEGTPALTVIPAGTTAVPVDPIPPPDSGLITGQAKVAGIGKFKVYRTSNFTNPSGSGGPTWDAVDLTGADEILTWVVDPFSPGYAPGATSGSIDGWLASATKLYRVEDLFGTPSCSAVVTFANTASWRTIQASFGAYFFAGQNPWLICISYYGSTGGHTGTWATYSKDGGATWAAEVQVSAFYDSGGAVNPTGLFMSPRTPGLAYTAAHIATANPATSHGFKTVDWGATWTEMTAAEDAVMRMPGWGISTHADKSVYSYLGAATSQSYTLSATSTGTTVQNYTWIAIHPPKNAKRIVLNVDWTNTSTKTGGLGSQGAGLTVPTISGYPKTGANNFSQATVNGGALSGSFTLEYVFTAAASGDWVSNREAVELSAPSSVSPGYMELTAGADASSGNTRVTTITVVVTCTEIELDDGTIYTPATPGVILPVHGMAGEIHYPYESNSDESIVYYGALNRSANRQFDLKRFLSGTLASISPNDGSRDYGVNHGQFGIRAYDSDRQKMILAGTGNDTSSSSSGDKQGVWVCINAGGSWTQIVAPTTSTEPYSAAFGGDDSDVIYVWGPASFIKYSSNFGSSLDDRSGNLSALSATHFVGIAGGPTP